jgi:glycosyltransferase involved in cell wall biosynthesis
LTSALKELGEKVTRNRQIASSILDDIPALRRQLRSARASADYERAFSDPEPLVSIRIATYNQAELLVERAIASALAQTYENTEIVVVGDGCTDDTEARVAAIGDSKIRFVNLPFRWPYPDDPHHRWLVAGSPAMNVAAQLARGLWIAPLDHDDEFVPDHVESLLTAARANEFEMMYGQIQKRSPDGLAAEEICTYPPTYEHFGFQASVYVGKIRFFEYDTRSWMLDESGDWNLCRRMLEAGVRIGFLDKVVIEYYPSRLW